MNTFRLLPGRRRFLQSASTLTLGLAGATLLPATSCGQAPPTGPNILGPRAGYAPHVGALVSMLDWMRAVVVGSVQGLSIKQLDYLLDPQANTIGSLLLHLVATERYYQLHTFEGKQWGDWDDSIKKQWEVPMQLGANAQRIIKGQNLDYYLRALADVRATTLRELRQRDDAWLMAVDPAWSWGPTNNYCKWFHVCEHESNHNGQIKWIKNRLPK
jgi:hypothetical protein